MNHELLNIHEGHLKTRCADVMWKQQISAQLEEIYFIGEAFVFFKVAIKKVKTPDFQCEPTWKLEHKMIKIIMDFSEI